MQKEMNFSLEMACFVDRHVLKIWGQFSLASATPNSGALVSRLFRDLQPLLDDTAFLEAELEWRSNALRSRGSAVMSEQGHTAGRSKYDAIAVRTGHVAYSFVP